MALHERSAADRLPGGDVVLDDGAEHLELAFVEGHGTSYPSSSVPTRARPAPTLALRNDECQSTSSGPPARWPDVVPVSSRDERTIGHQTGHLPATVRRQVGSGTDLGRKRVAVSLAVLVRSSYRGAHDRATSPGRRTATELQHAG